MSSLYFPIAAIFVAVLLLIVYYDKENEVNAETNIYSRMIFINIFESLAAILIIICAKVLKLNEIVFFLDKFDFVFITLWCSSLFEYVTVISLDKKDEKIKNAMLYVNVATIIILFISKFTVVNYDDIIDTNGLAPTLVGIFCAIYSALMLILLIINSLGKGKKEFNIKKYYPIFVFIVLIAISLFLRKFWPTMVLEPFMISFINLIMYFTIENPDMKMLKELADSRDKAEKYNNDKSIFIFNMSQKIKNPLYKINELVEDSLVNNNKDEVLENLNVIKEENNKLITILNNSLDITSLETKNLRLTMTPYKINNILLELSKKGEMYAKGKGLIFRKNFDSGLPEILLGDSIRLKQIINAIMINAIKYTEKGFVEFNVNSIIKYDVCRLIISIKDSGYGIPSQEIDKMFDDKLAENESLEIDSEELTLIAAKKMLNIIGGTITVETSKDEGTEFTIIIDQKIKKAENKIIDLADKYKNNEKSKAVLIVTDSEKEKLYFKKLLNEYDITFSSSGEEALKLIRSGKKYYRIIIKKDLKKLDGICTFKKMQGIKGFSTKTILLCDSVAKLEEIKYKNLGFCSVMSENASKEELKNMFYS